MENMLTESLIFARALSVLLEEGKGVIVDLPDEIELEEYPDHKRALVYHLDNMIHVELLEKDSDLQNGTVLNILDSY
jgi:hypothetical protein